MLPHLCGTHRAPEGSRFRPYDLVVVPRLEVDPEYFFTFSATGVMRMAKDVRGSSSSNHADFTPLAEWVHESTLFDAVSRIGFFKNYLTQRAFSRWHQVRIRCFA
jgi:dynein heavy chain